MVYDYFQTQMSEELPGTACSCPARTQAAYVKDEYREARTAEELSR